MSYPRVPLTREQGVARALKATTQTGYYRPGTGGRDPSKPVWKTFDDPKLGKIPAADCSAGANNFCGEDRWDEPTDTWYDTSEILADALRRKDNRRFKKVAAVDQVLPGDLLVYGDKDGRQGHVMMITKVLPGFKRGNLVKGQEWWRFIEGVDVSTRRGDRACRVRKGAVLWAARGYFVRYLHWVP